MNVLTDCWWLQVPQYLVTQKGFDLKSAGLLASLPLFSGFAGSVSGGLLMDGLHLGKVGPFTFTPVRNGNVRRGTHLAQAVYALGCTWVLATAPGPALTIFLICSANFFGSWSGLCKYCEFLLKWPIFQYYVLLKKRPLQSKFAVLTEQIPPTKITSHHNLIFGCISDRSFVLLDYKDQDISRRYAALSHGIMNGAGNLSCK